MTPEESKLVDKFMREDNSCSFIEYTDYNDWNNLMQVVEKIELLGKQTFNDMGITIYSRFEIKHTHIKLHWSRNHNYQLFLEVIPKWMSNSASGIAKEYKRVNITKETSKIEAMQLAVIGFINWYNKQKEL